jgi:hypothetical protein
MEMRNAYNILIGKSEGQSPLGGHRRTWEDFFKMNLKEMAFEENVHWVCLVLDTFQWLAFVNTVMELLVP